MEPKITVEDISGEAEQTAPHSAAAPSEVAHLAIAKRFNIDLPTDQESKQLAEVWQFASNLSETKDIPDIIWQVIHLEGVVGAPRLGESRLDRLYRYCKLRREESQIKEELKRVSSNNYL